MQLKLFEVLKGYLRSQYCEKRKASEVRESLGRRNAHKEHRYARYLTAYKTLI